MSGPCESLPCQREVPSVSEAEGFPPGCGGDGVQGKARQNPSGRLRRPPPFDKGGFFICSNMPVRRVVCCPATENAKKQKVRKN